MITTIENKRASAAITSVILIAAVLLSTGLTLVLTNIDLSKASRDYLNLQKSKLNSINCFEESLYEIKINTGFEGTIERTNPVGSCEATVTTDAIDTNIKIIAITSTVNNYYFNATKKIDTSENPFKEVK